MVKASAAIPELRPAPCHPAVKSQSPMLGHPAAPGAPGAPSNGPRVVDVVPTTVGVVVVEVVAGLVVVVVGGASVVFVVVGAVVSVGLVVVSVGLVVPRVAEVVVVAIRETVAAVLEVCWVMTGGVEVVVASGNNEVLAAVLVVVLGRVVVVTSTRPPTVTCRGGLPRVTSTRRSARESKASPYSPTLTRWPVDKAVHRARIRPRGPVGSS